MPKVSAGVVSALLAVGGIAGFTADRVHAAPAALGAGPLAGTWDTGAIPSRKIRAALVARGYSNRRVTEFLKQFGMTNAYRFKLTFAEESGKPFVYKSAWDPTTSAEPTNPDHGPYTLLPNRRFVARGIDPPTDMFRELYAYSIRGNALKLTLVRLTEPGVPKADLFVDTMLLRAATAFPYKRVT